MDETRYADPDVLQLLGSAEFGPNDAYIAVMGESGSGKGTFISKCTGVKTNIQDESFPCAHDIQISSFKHHDTTVHLIEMPSFDDAYRTDSDILRDMAMWLWALYGRGHLLSGIIYLHSVARNRLTATCMRYLSLFRKLCGEECFEAVALVTTMWDANNKLMSERETEIKETSGFWKEMIERGCVTFMHAARGLDANEIIDFLLNRKQKVVLRIQRELRDEGKSLDETSAGRELAHEWPEKRRRLSKEDSQHQRLLEANTVLLRETRSEKETLQKSLDDALKEISELKGTVQQLQDEKPVGHRRALKELERESKRNMEDSKQTIHRIEELTKIMRARDDEVERNRRKYMKEIEEMSLRFSKQNIENRLFLQQWISEQEKGSIDDPASVSSTFDSLSATFERPTADHWEIHPRSAGPLGQVTGNGRRPQ